MGGRGERGRGVNDRVEQGDFTSVFFPFTFPKVFSTLRPFFSFQEQITAQFQTQSEHSSIKLNKFAIFHLPSFGLSFSSSPLLHITC